jgi:predicted Zn-dependent protease with MMP-like domain
VDLGPPKLRQITLAALAAFAAGLGVVTLVVGFSTSPAVRLLQGFAVFGLGLLIVVGVVVLALVRLGGWKDPESEYEFEEIVRRAEELAAGTSWEELYDQGDRYDDGDRYERGDRRRRVGIDPADDEEFNALVKSAVDELPLEFHRALEHVAIVVADGGASARVGRFRRGAYGLYQGGTVAHDYFHDRIVIYRDTLLRDFGHDPDRLRAQVTRTLRHELAHHLGWDEHGVRELGL